MRTSYAFFVLAAVMAGTGIVAGLTLRTIEQQQEFAACYEPLPAKQTTPMLATFYGRAYHGRITASGARFDMGERTAAHRTLPFGTRLKVELDGLTTFVAITDRGPMEWTGRDLDLSEAAARDLNMIRRGVAMVKVQVVE